MGIDQRTMFSIAYVGFIDNSCFDLSLTNNKKQKGWGIMSTLHNHMQRTLNAIRMEKVDKIPFSYSGPAYVAHAQGLTIGEFVGDYAKATQANIDFCLQHPGIDTIHFPLMNPYTLPLLWLSEVKVPGIDLSEDELWQIHETERMTIEDYETIVKTGYRSWLNDYMRRIGDPQTKIGSFPEYVATCARRLEEEAGIKQINIGGIVGTPIEGFCGARTLMNFFLDIMDEPQLVKAAMEETMKVTYEDFISGLETTKPIGIWIGGWRAAPELMSHDTFMEFVWPYLEKLIYAAIDRDVLPILHFDSCWESELETINTLPARKCLLMMDGSTDMRKARSVLGDRMALMGDVPSTMLVLDTDNEVYGYVMRLIDDVGPKTGLIVSSGCDCPMNAKKENVDAMIQATMDYRV